MTAPLILMQGASQRPLRYGGTYSVQVQVKDQTQSHVFTGDRVYFHLNEPSIAAPLIFAAADATTRQEVELRWTEPGTLDGDVLTYEVELTDSDGNVTTYQASTAKSIRVGPLAADTYSWRVRAVDEHGLEGSWSAADEFIVSLSGALPVVTLLASPANVAPLVSRWTWSDPDGDVATDYQAQLATDAAFANVIEDSGVVASAALYHVHTATATGTYHRRVRVRTASTDWSEWAADTATITAPISQTAHVAIYLSASTVPTALDQTTYPVTGVELITRVNAPTELRFVTHNHDGLEAGIGDREELLVHLRTADGSRVEFRGAVIDKEIGDMMSVVAKDIGRLFEHWICTLDLSYYSVGQLVERIVANPDGLTPTGIICHCEEIIDDAGYVVRLPSWQGGGRTLAACLADLYAKTGYCWTIRYIEGAYHLYFYNQSAQAVSTITLRDDTDRADNSDSVWRVKDGVTIKKTQGAYRNRVEFTGVPDPPAPPGEGNTDYDGFFTDTSSAWVPFSPAKTQVEKIYAPVWHFPLKYDSGRLRGECSIRFKYTHGVTGGLIPHVTPLAYMRLPVAWQNWFQPSFGSWVFSAVLLMYRSAAIEPFAPADDDETQWNPVKHVQNLHPILYLFTSEAGIAGVASLTQTPGTVDSGSHYILPGGAWKDYRQWFTASYNDLPYYHRIIVPGSSEAYEDIYKHVIAIGLGVYLGEQISMYDDITNGYGIELWVDDMHVSVPEKVRHPSPLSSYVELASVTAGTEDPIPMTIDTTGMSFAGARALAKLTLAKVAKTHEAIGSVPIDGIRSVPVTSQWPLILSKRGVSGTYPVTQVVHRPLDAGDSTTVDFGDVALNSYRTIVQIRDRLDSLESGQL
jgi:hypothetical protein